MSVDKREFAWEFSQLSCPGQTGENKSCMTVDESWQASVYKRVFSHENKSYIITWELMRVDERKSKAWLNEDESRWELRSESLHENSLNSHAQVKRGESWWELRSESLHENSLNTHAPIKRGESWWELMRVEKREFAREFSQVSTLMRRSNEVRVDESWEARVCTRVLSSLNSHAPVKRGESWWELATLDNIQSLKQSLQFFLIVSFALFCRALYCYRFAWELHEGWQARICIRVFSTLVFRSSDNKSCIKVDESWQARVYMRVFSTLIAW